MISGSRSWKSLGLDIVTLRVYAAAVEERSLAGAAAREHLALSAVSRRIADLEFRSGVTLLNRDYRGVTPTPAGEILLARLGNAFALFDNIATELDALRDGTMGVIRMQAHMSAMAAQLPERLSAFCDLCPKVAVEIEERTSPEIIHNVQMGDVDIGFVSGSIPEDLQSLTWYQDELVVVLPDEHVLSESESVKFAEIMGLPFIGMQKDSSLQALYELQARIIGGQLQVRANNASFESVRRMVQAKLGVSILPRMAVTPYVNYQQIIYKRLDEPWACRPLSLCYRNLDLLSEAARKAIAHFSKSSDLLSAL